MPSWGPPSGEWKNITNPSSSSVARSGQCSTATPPAIGSGTEIATLDYDKELIFEKSVEFGRRVAAG